MATPIWRGSLSLIEQPTSPVIRFSDQSEMVREWRGPYALCLSSAPPFGSFGSGIAAGWRVTQTDIKKDRGGVGTLTVRYNPDGPINEAPLPPDEFSVSGDHTEQSILLHPRYATLSPATLHAIDQYVNVADTNQSWINANNHIGNLNGQPEALAYEAINKLEKKFTTFQKHTPTLTTTSYYWDPPANLTSGNVRQTPNIPGFTLPPGLDWLRHADSISFNGTHFAVQRKWVGAPQLDIHIYP